MGNMIGKSGVDWSKAPRGTTHVIGGVWLRKDDNGEFRSHTSELGWVPRSPHHDFCEDPVGKEDDLKVSKRVRSAEDLEVGMFVRTRYVLDPYLILQINGDGIDTFLIDGNNFTYHNSPVTSFISWSYTYEGEYTPIIKETEAEKNIKELEATIALVQVQLQRYKGTL